MKDNTHVVLTCLSSAVAPLLMSKATFTGANAGCNFRTCNSEPNSDTYRVALWTTTVWRSSPFSAAACACCCLSAAAGESWTGRPSRLGLRSRLLTQHEELTYDHLGTETHPRLWLCWWKATVQTPSPCRYVLQQTVINAVVIVNLLSVRWTTDELQHQLIPRNSPKPAVNEEAALLCGKTIILNVAWMKCYYSWNNMKQSHLSMLDISHCSLDLLFSVQLLSTTDTNHVQRVYGADSPVVWNRTLCVFAAAQCFLGSTGSPRAPVHMGSCTRLRHRETPPPRVRPLGCLECWSLMETAQTGKIWVNSNWCHPVLWWLFHNIQQRSRCSSCHLFDFWNTGFYLEVVDWHKAKSCRTWWKR